MSLPRQAPSVPSARTVVAFLVGVALLLQPVVGNGPGPDARYGYETTRVDLSNDETVEEMYRLSAVAYGTSERVEAVRAAANGTFARSESAVDPYVEDLTDARYVADDVRDRYYRVDARVTDGRFRLDATPVSAAEVARDLAVEADDAAPVVRDVLDGRTTASRRADATLVADDGRYLLVWVAVAERHSDPLVIPKVLGYALGVTLVVGSLTAARHRD